VLNNGEKQQEGSSREIYQEPTNEFVAEFVRKSTRFDGMVATASAPEIETPIGSVTLPDGTESSREVAAYVRPSDIDVSYERGGGANEFEGEVAEVTNLGNTNRDVGRRSRGGSTHRDRAVSGLLGR
jgi:ABC-type Fe3+/spermidine/putrescine transport system ATPase subunit